MRYGAERGAFAVVAAFGGAVMAAMARRKRSAKSAKWAGKESIFWWDDDPWIPNYDSFVLVCLFFAVLFWFSNFFVQTDHT